MVFEPVQLSCEIYGQPFYLGTIMHGSSVCLSACSLMIVCLHIYTVVSNLCSVPLIPMAFLLPGTEIALSPWISQMCHLSLAHTVGGKKKKKLRKADDALYCVLKTNMTVLSQNTALDINVFPNVNLHHLPISQYTWIVRQWFLYIMLYHSIKSLLELDVLEPF